MPELYGAVTVAAMAALVLALASAEEGGREGCSNDSDIGNDDWGFGKAGRRTGLLLNYSIAAQDGCTGGGEGD